MEARGAGRHPRHHHRPHRERVPPGRRLRLRGLRSHPSRGARHGRDVGRHHAVRPRRRSLRLRRRSHLRGPFDRNRAAVARAIEMAHARGLRVMLVPHLWVESGEWRALIDPETDEGWARWAESYGRFVRALGRGRRGARAPTSSRWASSSAAWVTTPPRPELRAHRRRRAPASTGARSPTRRTGTTSTTRSSSATSTSSASTRSIRSPTSAAHPTRRSSQGGERVRAKVHALAERWRRPVALHRDRLHDAPRSGRAPVGVARRDEPRARRRARRRRSAYRGLVAPLLDEPDFAGFFVWRVYADPDDVSQEAPWGFSPRGKLAETRRARRLRGPVGVRSRGGCAAGERAAGQPGLYP